MTAPALEIEGLAVELGGRAALDGAALSVRAGELVAVCGPNGAGKTTLLRAALGLVPRRAGTVRLGGRDLDGLGPAERAAAAAYLPQERRVAWNMPALLVAALGAITAPPAQAQTRAREGLARVGLGALEDRGVFDMSGGERARVLLARALAARAPLLLADEPAAGLDPEAALAALALLREEADQGAAVVVTLHDLGLAARFCDRVLVLHGGRPAAAGRPLEALSPEVLRTVFGLDAAWVESPAGPLLSAQRPEVVGGT